MAQAKASGKQPNVLERLTKYFKDVRSEVRRVVWPTRDDVANSSLVVIVMLVIMTGFVSLVDSAAYGIIINVFGKIGR
jgi:preprotein translocase subunit SecE